MEQSDIQLGMPIWHTQKIANLLIFIVALQNAKGNNERFLWK